jgi:hypothetical protein
VESARRAEKQAITSKPETGTPQCKDIEYQGQIGKEPLAKSHRKVTN